MHQQFDIATTGTDWRGSPQNRLATSMLLSALLLAGVLTTLRYQVPVMQVGLVEIIVQVVRPQQKPTEQEFSPVAPGPIEEPDSGLPGTAELPQLAGPAEQSPEIKAPPVDWQAFRNDAIQDAVSENLRTESINPDFERKREAAALQFRASEAPEKRFIWDNVEKDYLGRTILVHGDCHRVLDDPSAVYRDIFETFTQYLVFCSSGSTVGRELPWVAEVRARHGYLQRQLDMQEGRMSN